MSASFSWGDLLVWAQDEAGDASTEAARRAVVSRAYYACYHECLARAQRQMFTRAQFPGMGSHEALAAWCTMRPEAAWRATGKMLRTLKNRRHHADYNIRPLTADDMVEHVTLAADFIHAQMVLLP